MLAGFAFIFRGIAVGAGRCLTADGDRAESAIACGATSTTVSGSGRGRATYSGIRPAGHALTAVRLACLTAGVPTADRIAAALAPFKRCTRSMLANSPSSSKTSIVFE